MKSEEKILGGIIKNERIRAGIDQKNLCKGICVPSYLSKIEHGSVRADNDIIIRLFKKLGLDTLSEDELIVIGKSLQDAYEKILYGESFDDIKNELAQNADKIKNSVCAPDYYIIEGLTGSDTVEDLSNMSDCLTAKQRAYFAFIKMLYDADTSEAELKEAASILGNSFAYYLYANYLFMKSEYAKAMDMENGIIALCLDEGNVHSMAIYYSLKGSIYSCINREDLMMSYYHKAVHLLSNTIWTDELNVIYYNIGSTMISFRKYDEAKHYLDLVCDEENFLLLHKRATLAIRTGEIPAAKKLIIRMERLSGQEVSSEECKLRIDELRMECEKDFLDKPEYLDLLDRLINLLEKNQHRGHIAFYQDVYLDACRAQRKYRKAFEFQNSVQHD